MYVISMDELEELVKTTDVKVIATDLSKDDVMKKFVENDDLVRQLFSVFYSFEEFEISDTKNEEYDITDLVNLVLTEMMLPPLEDRYVAAKGVKPRHPFDVAKVIPLIPAYFVWVLVMCLPEDKEYALVEMDEAEAY